MAKKNKTRSAAKKRFSFTATGKVKYQKSGRRHLLGSKNAKRRRRLREAGIVPEPLEKTVHLMMPYGSK